MVTGPSLDWLRPSAIEGAWRLSLSLRGSKPLSIEQALRLAETAYASSGVDGDTAQEILAAIDSDFSGRQKFFRQVFALVLSRARPPWAALLLRGRVPFAEALDADAVECFRRCGGLDDPPAQEVVRWLDDLAASTRASEDLSRMEIGRRAERWSLELEMARLAQYSDAPAVEWVALNDNAAGYDIRSFDRMGDGFANKLIEVKGCSDASLSFILTRHEWATALANKDNYRFHIWHMRTRSLTELSWSDVAKWIPIDSLHGRWTEARLSIPGEAR